MNYQTERLVCVYARPASGPGWRNRPLWVVVENIDTGKMGEMCIQPEAQGQEIEALYDIAAEVDKSLCAAVKLRLEKSTLDNPKKRV